MRGLIFLLPVLLIVAGCVAPYGARDHGYEHGGDYGPPGADRRHGPPAHDTHGHRDARGAPRDDDHRRLPAPARHDDYAPAGPGGHDRDATRPGGRPPAAY